MTMALPDATVTDYEEQIDRFALADPDDRHVLAAAVTTGAAVLVTSNLGDFPAADIPAGLRVMSPDEFVVMLIGDEPDVVLATVEGPGPHSRQPADDDRRPPRRTRGGRPGPVGRSAPHDAELS